MEIDWLLFCLRFFRSFNQVERVALPPGSGGGRCNRDRDGWYLDDTIELEQRHNTVKNATKINTEIYTIFTDSIVEHFSVGEIVVVEVSRIVSFSTCVVVKVDGSTVTAGRVIVSLIVSTWVIVWISSDVIVFSSVLVSIWVMAGIVSVSLIVSTWVTAGRVFSITSVVVDVIAGNVSVSRIVSNCVIVLNDVWISVIIFSTVLVVTCVTAGNVSVRNVVVVIISVTAGRLTTSVAVTICVMAGRVSVSRTISFSVVVRMVDSIIVFSTILVDTSVVVAN